MNCVTNELSLDVKDCRGQCYDGAVNMHGKKSGVATRILRMNELALYTHCASHKLNLCVAASCQNQNVKNMMDNIQVISKFFNNSPKRQSLLEKMVKQHLPNYNHTKLIDACRTRWILCIDGLARFMEMYVAITEALFTIRDNVDQTWDTSASDAYALSSLCCNFHFIMTLVIVRMCLGYMRATTVQLQGAHIDIMKGMKEVDVMMKSLRTTQDLIDGYHALWFKKACSIAEIVDAPVKSPRVCGKQRNRSNAPTNDVSTHYKLNVAITFLDHLLQELSSRFTDKNCIALKGISILPAVMKEQYKSLSQVGEKRGFQDASTSEVSSPDTAEQSPSASTDGETSGDLLMESERAVQIQRKDKQWKEDFEDFCNQYANDLPNVGHVSHEVDNWESTWIDCPEDKVPQNIAETIQKVNPVSFPNIHTALKILAVLPVTSCTCERSASSIRLLKTYLRSTMTQERLNGLATLYTQRDITVDIDKVIDEFGRQHRRKMSFVNILNTDVNLAQDDDAVLSEIY